MIFGLLEPSFGEYLQINGLKSALIISGGGVFFLVTKSTNFFAFGFAFPGSFPPNIFDTNVLTILPKDPMTDVTACGVYRVCVCE